MPASYISLQLRQPLSPHCRRAARDRGRPAHPDARNRKRKPAPSSPAPRQSRPSWQWSIRFGRRGHALALLQVVQGRHQDLPASRASLQSTPAACRPAKSPPGPRNGRDSAREEFLQCARDQAWRRSRTLRQPIRGAEYHAQNQTAARQQCRGNRSVIRESRHAEMVTGAITGTAMWLASCLPSAPEIDCIDGFALELEVIEQLTLVITKMLDHLENLAAQRESNARSPRCEYLSIA